MYANFARKCVVFWTNLHSWKKITRLLVATNFKSVSNIKYQRPTISSRCSLTAHQRAEWPSPMEDTNKTLKYTMTLNHEI